MLKLKSCALPNWLPAALLTPLVLLQIGYSYGEPNHTILLPWILRRVDPSLLARDWFSNTIPHHQSFVVVMAWLARFVPLPAAMLGWHVLNLFFLLWVSHRLVGRVFDDHRVFYVALFLMLRWGTLALGGNSLWANYFLPHFAAVPFCLLAFDLVLINRPIAAALAAAAATWIHIQLGALTMLVLGLGLLVEGRSVGWRRILSTGAAYLALVAPTLVAQWRLYVGNPASLSNREFLNLHAILRQPHHLIPSSWGAADYVRFFLLLAIAVFAVTWRVPSHRTVVTWCAIILALCVVGTVFVEWVPVRLIIKLQLFRLTIFVKFFAVVCVARFVFDVLDKGNTLQKLCALAILAIQNFAAVALAAALILALRRKDRWFLGLGVFAAGAITSLVMVAVTSAGIPRLRVLAVAPSGVWVGVLTLAALAALVWRAARLLPAALLTLVVVVRIATGLPVLGYDHPLVDDWYRFCRQVRAGTPRDALFITPPYREGFATFAERAEIADFKATPSVERDLVEWKRRLDDLAGAPVRCSGWPNCGDVLAAGYRRLREHEFLVLARQYGAQYVVADHGGQRLAFPEVLRLEDFVLYRVPP